ncbi:RRNA (guanine-N1-)-methyltransferase, putative [Marinomonas sp. MED121]|uniref:putative RNA methyltransferase n=1 Tax=Marinomonas sp. MED121 TaxID=314277 RepID=UPI00006904EC|nr:methyltransferase domain-containing protein [Marinomonas sp. MED121]EAQ64718.1 RRNA (guanine-N1-)-methyltransferase, putative [Marinomonas sp. MED121]
MLNDLICPLDSSPLTLKERTLICQNGHSFDLAKTGYANLLPVQNKRSKDPGDSKAMVQARQAFLNSQAYLPIAQKLHQILTEQIGLTESLNDDIRLLDAGCGEGYYLSYLATQEDYQLKSSVGLDISKWAVAAASKRNKALSWLVASNAHLPMPENRFDAILCLFGFPVWSEFERVLSDQGFIVVADSGEDHLLELRQVLYPEIRPHKAPNYDGISGFKLISSQSIRFSFEVNTQQALMDLLAMTPHMHKAPYAGRKAIEALTHLRLTADVTFSLLQKQSNTELENNPNA